MGKVITLIRDEWYPAWDSGDAERLACVSRHVFAEDAELFPSGVDQEPLTLREVLPSWLDRLETWRPQVHEVIHAVEEGDMAAWEYRWHATHAGPIVVDGRLIQPTNRVFHNAAFVMARCNGEGKVDLLRGASSYHLVLEQLCGRMA